MMGVETIKALNREVAAQAAAEDRTPYVYFSETEVDDWFNGSGPAFPFSSLGDFRPDGWELIDTLFVDHSGFGRDDEPALSANQLRRKVKELIRTSDETLGFAIVESGQFQSYLGIFMKV